MKKSILLLVLCFSISAAAQTTGEIFGTVMTQMGDPLPGVVVTAQSPELEEDETAISAENGNFILRMIPPGNYKLTATMDGMKDQEIDLEVTLLAPARTTFVLTPKSTEE